MLKSLKKRKPPSLSGTLKRLSIALALMIALNICAYFLAFRECSNRGDLKDASSFLLFYVAKANLLIHESFDKRSMDEAEAALKDAAPLAKLIGESDRSSRLPADFKEYCIRVKELNARLAKLPAPKRNLARNLAKNVDCASIFDAILMDVADYDRTLRYKSLKHGSVQFLILLAILADSLFMAWLAARALWISELAWRRNEEVNKAVSRSLEEVLKSLDSSLFIIDCQGRLLGMNEKAVLYFGVSPANAVGGSLGERVPLLARYKELVDAARSSRSSKGLYRERACMGGAGQKESVFNVKTIPFNSSGSKLGCVLLRVDDVTKREVKDEQVRQSQKLEIAERLVSAIAHDLNNEFACVTGALSLMRFSVDRAESEDEIAKLIPLVMGPSEKAASMIKHLLMTVQKRKDERFRIYERVECMGCRAILKDLSLGGCKIRHFAKRRVFERDSIVELSLLGVSGAMQAVVRNSNSKEFACQFLSLSSLQREQLIDKLYSGRYAKDLFKPLPPGSMIEPILRRAIGESRPLGLSCRAG